MNSELRSEHLSKNNGGTNSLMDIASNLDEKANDMETHGWIKEAADLRKWASELREYLATQNYSLNP